MLSKNTRKSCFRRLRGAVAGLVAGGALAFPGTAMAQEIALYKIVDLSLITEALDGFKAAVLAAKPDATFKEYDAQGQANLFPTIARQIVRDAPDLVAVIGTPVVLATVQQVQHAGSDLPVIFIAMGDPVGAGIAESLDAPGGTATGTTDWVPPEATLATLRAALPELEKIGTIWDPANQNGKVFHDELAGAVESAGLDLVDVSIGSPGEVFMASQSLSGRADVIVIGPDSAIIQGLPAVGSAALKSKTPLIITAGDLETPGVLMSLGVKYSELGSLAGDMAVAVLDGTAPGTIPIIGPKGVTVSINGETKTALGLEITDDFSGVNQ